MPDQAKLDDAMGEDSDSATTEVESCDEALGAVQSMSEKLHQSNFSSRFSCRPKVLLLFSGPLHRMDSLQHFLEKFGFVVTCFDKVNGPEYDLADDAVWGPLCARINSGEFAATVISPPCGTFSRLRSIPGGPPILRGVEGSSRYGLPKLSIARAEQVRLANLLAVRGLMAFRSISACGGVAIFEQPALIDNEVSMLRLDEAKAILAMEGVEHVRCVQCAFGAASSKPTSLVSHRVSFTDAPTECKHQPVSWYQQRTGHEVVSKHAPCKGTALYFRDKSQALAAAPLRSGRYVSAALAYYPELLNRYLAAKIALASRGIAVSTAQVIGQHPWSDRLGKEKVLFSQPLRGIPAPDAKEEEDRLAVGGLRCAKHAVDKLSSSKAFGRKLGLEIQKLLMTNLLESTSRGDPRLAWVHRTCELIGTDDKSAKAPSDAVQAVRSLIREATCHVQDTRSEVPDCTTDVDHSLLESWRRAACDPDVDVCEWLRSGAPAGLALDPNACGIFPELHDEPEQSVNTVFTDYDTFANYAGVEDDEVALEDVQKHIAKGHLKSFDSLDDLRVFLGGADPILNKIGIISKERAGVVKKRMILDTKVSGLKSRSAKHQRVLLPRLMDAIMQGLSLQSKCNEDQDMEWFVLDFVEAFWQVPLAPAERRFFCTQLTIDGTVRYLVYLRTVQGPIHPGGVSILQVVTYTSRVLCL